MSKVSGFIMWEAPWGIHKSSIAVTLQQQFIIIYKLPKNWRGGSVTEEV